MKAGMTGRLCSQGGVTTAALATEENNGIVSAAPHRNWRTLSEPAYTVKASAAPDWGAASSPADVWPQPD